MTSLVIGAGPAGMRLARRLAHHGDVLVLDADIASPQATETRPQLLERLQPDQHATFPLSSLPPNLWILPGRQAVHIDRKNCQIVDDSGQRHGYSQLFLALGATPLLPELPGSQLDGVQTLYNRHQLDALIEALAHEDALLILGGGLLAVELAALVADRASVTLVSRSRLLGRYLKPAMSISVVERLEKRGIRVLEQALPRRLLGNPSVTGLELMDGRQLATRRVVLACGIQPHTTLAQEAGLQVDNGILVNDAMNCLGEPNIFAVGDCTQPPWPMLRGNITQVLHQADLALATALNEPPPVSLPELYQECQLGSDYRLVLAASSQTVPAKPEASRLYRRGDRILCVTMRHRRVIAFHALLPHLQAKRLAGCWEKGVALSRWELASLRRLVWLPPRRQADPVICHCAKVRRSDIKAAITRQGTGVEAICQATQAGLYCGGCIDDIAILSGGNNWRSRMARWSTAMAILLTGLVLGMLPGWPAPGNVLDASFATYRFMTDSTVRDVSGYLLIAATLLTLAIRGSRQRYWWHILLGSLALLLLPLHSLGGLSSGTGLNTLLVGLMLLTILSGALVMLRRRWTGLHLGHLAATVLLLTATLMHVVFVFQY